MFKIGDKVIYGSEGVCEITDITKKEFNGLSAEFYVLSPTSSHSSTFFVPTNSQNITSKIKGVLSFDELKKVMEKSTALSPWQADDNLRKENFRSIIQSGNTEEIVSMLKAIYLHKKEIEAMGKKLHRADETACKEGLKIICGQFLLYKDVSKDDIEAFLSNEN